VGTKKEPTNPLKGHSHEKKVCGIIAFSQTFFRENVPLNTQFPFTNLTIGSLLCTSALQLSSWFKACPSKDAASVL
jgi:hypothetical protein